MGVKGVMLGQESVVNGQEAETDHTGKDVVLMVTDEHKNDTV